MLSMRIRSLAGSTRLSVPRVKRDTRLTGVRSVFFSHRAPRAVSNLSYV